MAASHVSHDLWWCGCNAITTPHRLADPSWIEIWTGLVGLTIGSEGGLVYVVIRTPGLYHPLYSNINIGLLFV
ncbi:hypothetical protein BJY04DRAFT_14623 [Aspergillus karnatakaensis]|uniref:uncharacterized protein n=1 Tax=Aspergillus karnatakaensis TaxID=1810916 RepID=UPI003CCCE497